MTKKPTDVKGDQKAKAKKNKTKRGGLGRVCVCVVYAQRKKLCAFVRGVDVTTDGREQQKERKKRKVLAQTVEHIHTHTYI